MRSKFKCYFCILLIISAGNLITTCGQGDNPITSNKVETGSVTDIDGNIYKTVKIGNQWWMAENLKVTHYRNGDSIPNLPASDEWIASGLTSGAYCDYENNIANVDDCGRLYNWYAVVDGRNIAPEGWHVPTDNEWKQLEMYLGISQAESDSTGKRGNDEGGKLKEDGTVHWKSPNTGATNESGFTACPCGRRWDFGEFFSLGSSTYFWSSTGSTQNAWYRRLEFGNANITRYRYNMKNGYSVRCVKD